MSTEQSVTVDYIDDFDGNEVRFDTETKTPHEDEIEEQEKLDLEVVLDKEASKHRGAKVYTEEGSSIQIHPDVRFSMLAARASGMLGERAYKRVFDLEPTDIGMLIAFCEDLRSCKERETPEQKKARGA